jgi:hypothetical protein
MHARVSVWAGANERETAPARGDLLGPLGVVGPPLGQVARLVLNRSQKMASAHDELRPDKFPPARS